MPTKYPKHVENDYGIFRGVIYGLSHMGWNSSFAGLAVFSKTLLRTNSPTLNICGFTRWLCKLANLCWYEVIRTAAASRSSSTVSRSLITALVFASSRIFIQMVGIPISVGMIASIPYVRVNGDSPVGFWLVVQ